ncbi:MAG TPA: SRPBCC family protein, partial [Gaiellaceae bacterium]|nr:SRPBCC family protein [Gaiellaceae bacterium]
MPHSATEVVPAPRADVWAVLAEPLHLPDWWPGLLAVEPDRRGFAPGARWAATVSRRNPFFGARRVETALLLRDVELYERWTWHLGSPRLDVE